MFELPLPPYCTLNCSFEEGFARLAGSHTIVIARRNVPAHQAQPLGDGIEHVLALGGRVLHDGAGTVVIALTAGPATNPRNAEHGWRVQAIRVATHGDAIATTSVRGAAGTVMADGINAGRWAGRLSLDEGSAAGGEMPLLRGHSAKQPAGREPRNLSVHRNIRHGAVTTKSIPFPPLI